MICFKVMYILNICIKTERREIVIMIVIQRILIIVDLLALTANYTEFKVTLFLHWDTSEHLDMILVLFELFYALRFYVKLKDVACSL